MHEFPFHSIMSGFRKPAEEESDGTQPHRVGSAIETSSSVPTHGGMMEGYFYTDIFNVLSNVELPSTLPEEAIVTSNIVPNIPKPQYLEMGESSGGKKKKKSTAPQISHSDSGNQRRDSKKSRRDHQPRRSRSTELHNMSERIRRDQIRRKMKALQDLIPNCNRRDKASMLDDAIKYIKALQNQVLMMSTGAGAMLQNPYALQAAYQGVQVPQFPSQFMPMRLAIGMGMGMGMYGMSSSTALPVMPFPLASPCQSTIAASGMAMVGPMPQLQLPLNPFQSLSSADSTFTVAPISFTSLPSTFICTPNAETSSQSVPRKADFCQVPLMSQGSIVSGSSAIVLPTQIISPAASSSTSVVAHVPHIQEEDNDNGSSQRI